MIEFPYHMQDFLDKYKKNEPKKLESKIRLLNRIKELCKILPSNYTIELHEGKVWDFDICIPYVSFFYGLRASTAKELESEISGIITGIKLSSVKGFVADIKEEEEL